MALYSKPNLLNVIWASGGDRVAPDASKYNTGWLAEIPPRQYFNFIDWKQDQWAAYSNQFGIPEWDNETEYQANKSYVQGSNGVIYQCLVTGTNINPVTDTASRWKRASVDDAPSNGIQYVRRNNAWQQLDTTAFAPVVHTHTIAQVTGLQNALNNKLDITGATPTLTSTGSITMGLNSAASTINRILGKVGTSNVWSVGKTNAANNNVVLDATLHGTNLTLATDRITSNKALYVSTNQVWHAGNFVPSNYAPVSHTHTIAQITSLQTVLNGKVEVAGVESTIQNTAGAKRLNIKAGTNQECAIIGYRGTAQSWHVGATVSNSNDVYLYSAVHGQSLSVTGIGGSCSGHFVATGNVTAYSDVRYKNVLRPVKGVTSSLNSVSPFYYTWKEDAPVGVDAQEQLGFSAQEMQKAFPHLVIEDEEGILSVDYGRCSAVLWQALKETNERLERLENLLVHKNGG